jgi:hypothetical protein
MPISFEIWLLLGLEAALAALLAANVYLLRCIRDAGESEGEPEPPQIMQRSEADALFQQMRRLKMPPPQPLGLKRPPPPPSNNH